MDNGAVNGCVTVGPTADQFTVINSAISGSQLQTWRYGQTDLPLINYDVADEVYLARWSPDGSMLAAVTGVLATQNGFYLWKRGQPLKAQRVSRPQRDKFLTFAVIADTIAWSPVDPHLLLVSDADQANIWDVRKNQPLLTLAASADSSTPVISKMSWSPNGRYVAASYDPVGDNTKITVHPQIFVWDVRALLKQTAPGVRPPTLTFSAPIGSPAHTRGILDLNWSPDGRYLATSSFDNTVIIWKVDR
jgi:WD40 repeat protein